MIIYIVKIILCSAIFAITYKILLEKEKMYRFNRFYLLASLLLSILIPVITISSASPIFLLPENSSIDTNIFQDNGVIQSLSNKKEPNYIFSILLTIYVTITTLLLFRFINNLNKILTRARTNQIIPYRKSKIVLINENLTPHSFLKYMFITTQDYKNGNIECEILTHEYAHIRQRHSLDILFIEILQIIFWINPLIFFYRKAILLNHEFMADEKVVNECQNIYMYQHLLIEKANKNKTLSLTSQFNYSTIKKRLIMITKNKSFKSALLRQIAVIPILIFSIFLFSTKTFAQEKSKNPKQIITETPSTQEGIPQELLNEYEQIVNKTKNEKGVLDFGKLSDTDKTRLQTMYFSMSKDQQAKQTLVFIRTPPPRPRIVPTQSQLEAWKNAKVYGVWIDKKRVSNSVLNDYHTTDFANVYVSKLTKTALNYGKHYYQVDLMTTKEYENYYKKSLEEKDTYHMGVRIVTKNE